MKKLLQFNKPVHARAFMQLELAGMVEAAIPEDGNVARGGYFKQPVCSS